MKSESSLHRSSRNSRGWCSFPACSSLARLCSDQDSDLQLATTLARVYPHNVMVAKFEHLVTRPKLTIEAILKFLGLPWHPALTKFMSDHMVEDPKHKMEGDLHTQSVNSSAKADQWRSKLTRDQKEEIDRICGGIVERHQNIGMNI